MIKQNIRSTFNVLCAGLLSIGTLAQPKLATAQEAGAVDAWILCEDNGASGNGSKCYGQANKLMTSALTQGGRSLYLITEGTDVPCDVVSFGNPQPNVFGVCHKTMLNLFDAPLKATPTDTISADTSMGWLGFGSGASPELTWVRYGKPADEGNPAKWVYFVTQKDSLYPCQDNIVPFDPAPSVDQSEKVCQLLGPAKMVSSPLDEANKCALNNDCPIGQGPALVKYGNGSGRKNTYHFTSSTDGKMRCQAPEFDNWRWGAGNNKPTIPNVKSGQAFCYAVSTTPGAVVTTGRWHKQKSCTAIGDDVKCGPIDQTITVGATYTGTSTTETDWQLAISESFEVGIDMGVETDKEKTTVSAQFGQSYIHSDAFGTSKTVTTSASCEGAKNAATNGTFTFWQFGTESAGACLEGANPTSCSVTAKSQNVLCTFTAKGEPASAPVCLPGYCANASCTKCDYPDP
ncbi:hypothetical protein HKX62_15405 [Sulfitobacter sp. M74]|nr:MULTISPECIES: hypothetical protein [unclassified Sulfitobacter]MDF3434396.1 hypothetical protein [Sulfitobacter sp. KE42]MDF3491079.1 hypothetical protein [Sulfitobacter sp. M60]MDF3522283.1 hypothetical protein [Sulfitobacter sp. M74]MDF3545710.1 hypothetical protein [Sulfitobacter sp. M72]